MHTPPWTWSEEHDDVYAAYIHALNAGLRVGKSETVDTGKYEYRHATLESTVNAIDGELAKNACRITTLPAPGPDSQSWSMIVTIIHENGQWMAFPPYVRPLVKDEQGHGSAVTYSRRYALTAIFSLLPSDDDDGKAATDIVRNENQLHGSRTEEELSVRTLLKHLSAERRSLLIEEFKTEFGKTLAELAPGKHRAALDWMSARVHQPDPDPEESDYVEATAEERPG